MKKRPINFIKLFKIKKNKKLRKRKSCLEGGDKVIFYQKMKNTNKNLEEIIMTRTIIKINL